MLQRQRGRTAVVNRMKELRASTLWMDLSLYGRSALVIRADP